jgi:death-on-curing protein
VSAPAFLEPDAVLFLHDQSIREYGGYHGLRDEALLSSALNRPVDRFGYDPQAALGTLGAAYAFGIAKNHAFLDGNKRTAWAACVLFLKINGVELNVSAADAVEAVVSLATGGISEEMFAGWLHLRFRA